MQYKSKARQSTTADLQLQESISLVNTLDGWRVIDQIKQVIEKKIYKILEFIELNLKISQGSPEMAYLYKNSIIKDNKECSIDSQYMIMHVLINKVNALKFIKLFPHVTISK